MADAMRDRVTNFFQRHVANPLMRRLPIGVRTFGTNLLSVRVDLTN